MEEDPSNFPVFSQQEADGCWCTISTNGWLIGWPSNNTIQESTSIHAQALASLRVQIELDK